MLEEMAALVHEVWAEWMKYMFSVGLGIHNVSRWKRQMNTPYSELSEEEKESSRGIAKRYMRVMGSPRRLSLEDQNVWSVLLIKMIYDRLTRAGMGRDQIFEWFADQLALCKEATEKEIAPKMFHGTMSLRAIEEARRILE